jgi:hypothetical protein
VAFGPGVTVLGHPIPIGITTMPRHFTKLQFGEFETISTVPSVEEYLNNSSLVRGVLAGIQEGAMRLSNLGFELRLADEAP